MEDNKRLTFQEVFDKALELAKNDPNHQHFFNKEDHTFVSIGLNEIDDYLEHVDEEGEDEFLDDIIDSGNYIAIPKYIDDSSFIKNLSFSMDYNEAFLIETPEAILKDLYEFAYEIYKAQPFKYFNDRQFVVSHTGEELEDMYIVILGNAGQVYGVSFYYGEDALSTIEGITNETHKDDISIYAYSQKCLTFYFDEPKKAPKESKELTKKYLGEEIANEVVISTLIFDGHAAYNNLVSFSKAFFYIPFVESFKYFALDFNKQGKMPKLKKWQHYAYYFNEETNEVTIKKEMIEPSTYYISEDFIYSIPKLVERDTKKSKKEYEFKIFSAPESFSNEFDERISYMPVIAAVINHKTGKVIALNVVLSQNKYYLDELFDPIIDKLIEEGYPSKVYVDSYLDLVVASRIFDLDILSFGDTEKIQKLKEEVLKDDEMSFDA